VTTNMYSDAAEKMDEALWQSFSGVIAVTMWSHLLWQWIIIIDQGPPLSCHHFLFLLWTMSHKTILF